MSGSGVSSERKSSRPPAKAKPTRVLILAASPMLRFALERLLESDPNIELAGAGEVKSSSTAQPEADVAVVHGDGEDLKELAARLPSLPLILVAERIDERLIRQALDAGVAGLLPAESPGSQLASAVHAAAAGLTVFSPGVLGILQSATRQPAQAPPRDGDSATEFWEDLTSREHEVLEMLMEGLSNKEIAVQLNLSLHTVKFHISSVLAKLGAQSRTEATVIGLRRGLIHI